MNGYRESIKTWLSSYGAWGINSSLVSDFIRYVINNIIVRGISIMVMPALLRKLSPTEYGKLSLISSFITISIAILGLGLRQKLAVDYFGLTPKEKIKSIQGIITLYSIIAAPMLMLLYLILPRTSNLFFCVDPLLFSLILTHIFVFFFAELIYQWLQYERYVQHLMLTQITTALTIVCVTYIAVSYLDKGISGVIAGQLAGVLIPFFVGLHIYCSFGWHQSFNPLPFILSSFSYLKKSFPFIYTVLFSWILTTADRWMLSYVGTLEQVGIYAVADMACQLFYFLIIYPWSAVYLPYMLKTYHKNTHQIEAIEYQNHRFMWYTLFILAGLIFAASIILKPIAFTILPPAFHCSYTYVPILLIGQLFLLGGYFCSCLIQYYKKGPALAWCLAIAALTNLCLNAFLIPLWGLYGCTYATTCSYLVYFVLMYVYNRSLRLHREPQHIAE